MPNRTSLAQHPKKMLPPNALKVNAHMIAESAKALRTTAVPAPHAAWWRLWHEPPEMIDAGWVRMGVAKLIARGKMPPLKAVQAYPRLLSELGSVGGRFRLYRLLVETANFESPGDTNEIYWFAGPVDALHSMLTAVGVLYAAIDLEHLPDAAPLIEHDPVLCQVLAGLIESTRECLHPDSLAWLAPCGKPGSVLDLQQLRQQRLTERSRRPKPRLGARPATTSTWSGQAYYARLGMSWLTLLLKDRIALLQRLQVRLPREWAEASAALPTPTIKRLSPNRVWTALSA